MHGVFCVGETRRRGDWPSSRSGLTSFNYDRAETLASLERIKQIEENLKATVIIQHDPRDVGKLPAFPAAAR